MMAKELDLNLTLGMAKMTKTESPPDEESWGGGQRFESRSDPESPSIGISCPISHCTGWA